MWNYRSETTDPPFALTVSALAARKDRYFRSLLEEDSQAGVKSGQRGHFGLVLAVDRAGQGESLVAAGADIVVKSLGDLALAPIN